MAKPLDHAFLLMLQLAIQFYNNKLGEGFGHPVLSAYCLYVNITLANFTADLLLLQ